MNCNELKNYIIPTTSRELDSPYINANSKDKVKNNSPESVALNKKHKTRKKKSLVLQKSGESTPKKINQKIKKEIKKPSIQMPKNCNELKNYIIPTTLRELNSPYVNANSKDKVKNNSPESISLGKKKRIKNKKNLVLRKSGESKPKKITQKIKREIKKPSIQVL